MYKLLITLLFLCSCKHEIKSYYVVGKQKIDCGMCCDVTRKNVVTMSVVIVPHTTINSHHHKFEPSEFYLAIARPYECFKIKVDSITFIKTNIKDPFRY